VRRVSLARFTYLKSRLAHCQPAFLLREKKEVYMDIPQRGIKKPKEEPMVMEELVRKEFKFKELTGILKGLEFRKEEKP
jgi:hypothetical protein